ncbi:MAG TPA: VOC family protein [Arsenicitalea sp.]|nr:VOC family protein [Arsenicitalea sp.]
MGIIKKIGYARFTTPDIQRLSEYYQGVLGMAVQAHSKEAVFLNCPQDHHSVVLQRGDQAACAYLGLEVASEDKLLELRQRLLARGLDVSEETDPAPGVARRLSFAGPSTFRIEVQAESAVSPAGASKDAINPLRLGHVAFKVADPQATVKFLCDLLEFRESDWIGDYFAFLRCGSDHHTVNVLRHADVEMHHIAFQLTDFNHIKKACDFLGKRHIALLSGPGRHGPGHNIFTYHKNPDGQTVELYAELDQMSDEERGYFDPMPWHEDSPQRPKVWEPGLFTTNSWGVPRNYDVRN